MNNIERIEEMERRFDRVLEVFHEMEAALEHYEAAQEDIRVLDAYLGSDDWKVDLAADEAGQLPFGLKRGVLSEDGIWNLLEGWRELELRVKGQGPADGDTCDSLP